MKIYHVTSAFIAQRLLVNSVFSPHGESLAEPRGLHAYSFKPGYFFDQQTQNQGVKLVLKWTGQVQTRSYHDPRPMQPNVLYIQFPWRCFLLDNQGMRNLQIIGLLDDHSGELPQQLGINLSQGWLSKNDYRQMIKAKCNQYLRNYWRECATKPVYLNVCGIDRNINDVHDDRLVAEHVQPNRLSRYSHLWGADHLARLKAADKKYCN